MSIYDTENPITVSLASNDMGPFGSFQFRKHWKDNAMQGDLTDVSPVDFWYGKLFYGRIDGSGVIVYPSETNLKQIPDAGGQTLWALDFVVDAFVDFSKYIKRAVGKGAISPDSTIADLTASRAWVSLDKDYDLYMESVYNHIVAFWLQGQYKNSKISNFSDFLREFLELVDSAKDTMHFTKSGHIMSKYFSPLSSGLMIEVAAGDHSLDVIKEKQWTEDPSFSFYRNAAKNHGFLIDKNAPWRLVADINSEPMSQYMSQYGVSGKDLFDAYYYKSHQKDIESLKIYLMEMYNAYAFAYPEVKKTRTKIKGAGGVKTVSRLITRAPINIDDLNRKFPAPYWLKTYYYIRLREMQAPINIVDFNLEVEKIYRAYKYLDFDKALDYINSRIRKLKVP